MNQIKKVLAALFLFMLCTTVFAQHMKFMGIPIDGTISSFTTKLQSKGIRISAYNKTACKGLRLFTGVYYGHKAEFGVFYDPSSKIVYAAQATIERNNYNYLKALYDEIFESISKKYQGEYEEGEYNGFPSVTCNIDLKTSANFFEGTIDLSFSEDDDAYYLHVHYRDEANCRKYEPDDEDDESNENNDGYTQNSANDYSSSFSDTYEDVDYYLAQVTTDLNLREGPGTDYNVAARIPRGEFVFLSTADAGQAFRKVLYVDKNIFGYVSKNYLTNFRKVEEDNSGNLQVESRNYKATSDIKIENRTDRTTTIAIGRLTYKFRPYETRTISDLKPGKYKVMASSPGVRPYVGLDTVAGGYLYSWVFYINTVSK